MLVVQEEVALPSERTLRQAEVLLVLPVPPLLEAHMDGLCTVHLVPILFLTAVSGTNLHLLFDILIRTGGHVNCFHVATMNWYVHRTVAHHIWSVGASQHSMRCMLLAPFEGLRYHRDHVVHQLVYQMIVRGRGHHILRFLDTAVLLTSCFSHDHAHVHVWLSLRRS